MPLFRLQDILELQNDTESIRNICILAHVDHGKTTLADSLIAYNQLISPKLSGSLRYLDYREDEQVRGITMKSCSISIIYEETTRKSGTGKDNIQLQNGIQYYLINLIDSPGHLDFTGEFSAASRISDGALILIDVVEGICTQTIQAIKEVWSEKISPVLVINKIDKLITDLKMDPLDAYKHICQILEQVNASIATFHNEMTSGTDRDEPDKGSEDGNSIIRDSLMVLHPSENNVIFASAIDQWGFSISDFAEFYNKKYGFSESVLNKTLWGDYYLDSRTKTIKHLKMSSNKSQKPIFVELVLENIWSVYDTLIKSKDKCKIDKMADALNIKISSYDLKSKDRRKVLRTFMGQWMPIAPAILRRLTECVGSPKAFGEERLLTSFTVCKDTPEHIIVDMETCSKYSDTVFVFCPKIFIVEKSMINVGLTSGENSEHIERRRFADIARNNQLIYEKSENLFNRNYDSDQSNNLSDSDCTSESSYLIVGLVRIYSGTIKCGQTLHVYGPNYNIDVPDKHTYSFEVESLYILMGRELVETRSVTAGNIFGVRLPDTHSFKTCMISSHSPGYIKSNYTRYVPIVRVAVEPKNPTQIQRLVNGLKRLNQSDSSVEVYFSDTGEHIIAAAGELHLEKCLDDLREVFAKISIQSSSPIVPFRETVANICGSSNFSNKSFQLYFQRYFKNLGSISPGQSSSHFNTIVASTPGSTCSITVQSWKIPDVISELLNKGGSPSYGCESMEVFVSKLIERGCAVDSENQKSPILWGEMFKRIIGFGPGSSKENILVDHTSGHNFCNSAWLKPGALQSRKTYRDASNDLGQFLESVRSGFDLAVSKGPLCEEQVTGLCFVLKEFTTNGDTTDGLIGKIITMMRDACISSMISWSLRISLAMYSCDLLAPPESLGKIHAVLGRRGGTVYSEQHKEGTPLFEVKFKLPVINSFGFAQEMRKRTSGIADPQMHFCGFEPLDMDPFWIPTTEDELEDLGEKSDRDNQAKKIVDLIRKRKGLPVDQKVVEHAEKQRNIKNK